MITACQSLRHFSVNNCFSNSKENFNRKNFLSCATEPWHTITHLAVSACECSTHLTINLLSAGTITHFAFREPSEFTGARPGVGMLLDLRATLCAHAHKFKELIFSIYLYHEYKGFSPYLDPIIALLTSCERLVLFRDHIESLSLLHLPNLPRIKHIAVMGVDVTDDSEDVQQLAEFLTQHVGTLKTIRASDYCSKKPERRRNSLIPKDRQVFDNLCQRGIDCMVQIKFEIGNHYRWIQDEDMYLDEFELSPDTFDKYYFEGYQYETPTLSLGPRMLA